MKPSEASEAITVTSNNSKREKFSDQNTFSGKLIKDGMITKEVKFRKNHSSDENVPRESNRKNSSENKPKKEKTKSAKSTEVITVTHKDSGLETFNDESFKDETLTKEKIIQNNCSSDRKEPQENNLKNVNDEKDKDEKVKAEVENPLSEVLAIVDCRNQVKEHSTRKTAEQTPTDREFVSFMYVNQGYFNSPYVACYPVAN